MKSKSKKPAAPTSFDFWKNNRLDQHFTLTLDELKEQFTKWIATKEQSWIEYYRAERVVRAFITEKDGLSSVFEEDQLQYFYEPLTEIIFRHVK